MAVKNSSSARLCPWMQPGHRIQAFVVFSLPWAEGERKGEKPQSMWWVRASGGHKPCSNGAGKGPKGDLMPRSGDSHSTGQEQLGRVCLALPARNSGCGRRAWWDSWPRCCSFVSTPLFFWK